MDDGDSQEEDHEDNTGHKGGAIAEGGGNIRAIGKTIGGFLYGGVSGCRLKLEQEYMEATSGKLREPKAENARGI